MTQEGDGVQCESDLLPETPTCIVLRMIFVVVTAIVTTAHSEPHHAQDQDPP